MSRLILGGGGALLSLTAAAPAATIYVDESGGGPYPSPWNAPVTLSSAVGSAQPGDLILIATGTYSPGPDAPDHYLIRPGVELQGGWEPATNTRVSPLDPTLTVLDGDGLNDSNNHIVVIVGRSPGAEVEISGVTIQNGFPHTAPGSTDPKYGAGVQLIGTGGWPVKLRMEDCILKDNDGAANGGGGIGSGSEDGINEITLIDCVFTDNKGAAVWSEQGVALEISGCTFISNENLQSNQVGGAISAEGPSTVTISESWFEGNEAHTEGGAIYAASGGGCAVSDCVFIGNIADSADNSGGGAIFAPNTLSVDRCAFIANETKRFGGAVNCGPDSVITNSLFNKNSCDFGADKAGAIYAVDGSATPDIKVVNCTIVNNSAFAGAGGVWTDGEVHNCIIWDNVSQQGTQDNIHLDQFASPAQPISLTYSDVQGGVPTTPWGTTNINLDPRFTDIDGVDGVLGNLDDDYRLLSVLNSPCIDAGSNPRITGANPGISPLLDLDHQGRFFDDSFTSDTGVGTPPIVDMGCYEMDDPCTGGCTGDLNRDGQTDVDDLNLVLSNWNTEVGPCGPGDANGDGFVDVDDLNAVLSNWEQTCGGTGTQEEEQQQQMMQGPSDSELPADLQSLGFETWQEYREYLSGLTPTECFLHAFDVVETHETICGGASHE